MSQHISMSKVNFGLSSDRTYNLTDLGNKTRLSTRLGQPDATMIPNQPNNKLNADQEDVKMDSSLDNLLVTTDLGQEDQQDTDVHWSQKLSTDELESVAGPCAPSRRRSTTGTYCSAVDCHNCQSKGKERGIKFYRFPADPQRRKLWELRVKRADWQPTPASRLCSEHFLSGSKSDDPNDVDYLPSVFKTGHIKQPGPAALERANRAKARERNRTG